MQYIKSRIILLLIAIQISNSMGMVTHIPAAEKKLLLIFPDAILSNESASRINLAEAIL